MSALPLSSRTRYGIHHNNISKACELTLLDSRFRGNDRKGFTRARINFKEICGGFGFTLIELLVVISIIAILSVIGITVFSGVQKNARTAKRIADMTAIRLALEIYYNNNNSQYPRTDTLGGGFRTECVNPWGGIGNLDSKDVIPGIVPNYMPSFPSDPTMDKPNHRSCYMYQSNGIDYKLLDHDVSEFSTADYSKYRSLVDPARDGSAEGSDWLHPDSCYLDIVGVWSWQISTPGAKCW